MPLHNSEAPIREGLKQKLINQQRCRAWCQRLEAGAFSNSKLTVLPKPRAMFASKAGLRFVDLKPNSVELRPSGGECLTETETLSDQCIQRLITMRPPRPQLLHGLDLQNRR